MASLLNIMNFQWEHMFFFANRKYMKDSETYQSKDIQSKRTWLINKQYSN